MLINDPRKSAFEKLMVFISDKVYFVIPAFAGIHLADYSMDSHIRENDNKKSHVSTQCRNSRIFSRIIKITTAINPRTSTQTQNSKRRIPVAIMASTIVIFNK